MVSSGRCLLGCVCCLADVILTAVSWGGCSWLHFPEEEMETCKHWCKSYSLWVTRTQPQQVSGNTCCLHPLARTAPDSDWKLSFRLEGSCFFPQSHFVTFILSLDIPGLHSSHPFPPSVFPVRIAEGLRTQTLEPTAWPRLCCSPAVCWWASAIVMLSLTFLSLRRG